MIIFKFKNNKTAIMRLQRDELKNIEGSISVLGSKGSAKVGGFALNKFEFTIYLKKLIYQNMKLTQNLFGFVI